MPRGKKTRGKAGYMISAVAEMFHIHPQTLRLYEREGLLIPSRSEGNTRLYTQEDLGHLETVLNLTRELGVNLAGIQIILDMRKRMKLMEEEMQAFVEFVQMELLPRSEEARERVQEALVRVGHPTLTRSQILSRRDK
jgi:MerR family transcriptional regulator/heat shock protein HspR